MGKAQTQELPGATYMTALEHRAARTPHLARVNHILTDWKCRAPRSFRHNVWWFPADRRGPNVRYWSRQPAKARALRTMCPGAIIRAVFPDYAEATAIKVAKCESDHGVYLNVWAKNPDSTASGLFQELSGWWDGSLNNYLGGRAFNPFNPWKNTLQARWLWRTSGESFYTHWAASAGCW